MAVSIHRLMGRLYYYNMVVRGKVSDSALRILCRDILAMKGPLPVGEVGKMLQEMTKHATLSTILKDRYGGLKKFLERYPAVFLIG